jgi:hypothetical protein
MAAPLHLHPSTGAVLLTANRPPSKRTTLFQMPLTTAKRGIQLDKGLILGYIN